MNFFMINTRTIQGDKVWLRYSFTTVRDNVSYIGYNRLEYKRNKLVGEYFTSKPLPGEPGKGSKGIIEMHRVNG